MGFERIPFFLARAREWWDAAEMLRGRVPDGNPVLSVWREAAWCHLLLTKGLYAAVITQLKKVAGDVVGADLPGTVTPPRCEADVLVAAAELFARLRSVVTARYPFVFDRPIAA